MRATDDKLEERFIIPIARELVVGLRAIHDAGIIHRDIKGISFILISIMIRKIADQFLSGEYLDSRGRQTRNL
jgi:serine/threonine protein kinase